jgi:hypothetical protein
MAQLDELAFGNHHTQDSFSDKLNREGSLLASLPHNTMNGLKARAEDAWDHKLETCLEVGESVALGVGLALASKNQGFATFAKVAPWVAGALVTGDAAKRLGAPLVETWNDPTSLAANKVRLGANLGAMAFDYSLMGAAGAAGAAGARFGPGLVSELTGSSTGSATSDAQWSRALDRVTAGPALPALSARSADMKAIPGAWEDYLRVANKGNGNLSALKMPDGMNDPLKYLNLGTSEMHFLTTTTRIGLPFGTSMGLGVAAGSDLLRSRADTKLGALTQITPMQANLNEALHGIKLNSDKWLQNMNTERGTILQKSQEWLKKSDQN